VELRGVSKVFAQGNREFHALRDVTAAFHPGELAAIVGRSGSGKSTLLHLACGIEIPTSGAVLAAGRDLGTLPDRELAILRRRHFGIVFQFFNLIATLTVEENVLLPSYLDGGWKRPARARARELLEQVGLADRAADFPDRLSGGEQQRVALARALVNDPRIILADEPTGNLDSDNARFVLEHLRRLAHGEGRAVVMVTHSAEALDFADRVVRLRDGRVAE
jgi:putative ABC transport system ATP-binding protein